MLRQTLPVRGVAFCVDRLLTIAEARVLLCGERGGVKRTEVYSQTAVVRDPGEVDIEQ